MIAELSIEILRVLLIITVVLLSVINTYKLSIHKKVSQKTANVVGVIILLLLLAIYLGASVIVYLFFVVTVVWSILYAVSVNRIYLYGMSIVMIGISVVFLLLKYFTIAEHASLFSFFFLLLAVFKDIIYEKLFNN